MTSNFYSLIHEQLIGNPDKIFLKFPDVEKKTEYSGKEILSGVAQVYQSLVEKKIKKGKKILVIVPFSFPFVCTFLGIMAYGAIPVLPPAKVSKTNLAFLVRRQNIKSIFLAELNGFSAVLLRVFGIKVITTSIDSQNTRPFEPELLPKTQVAFISFSSGSTGRPTAVERGHQVLIEQHIALKRSFPPLPDQQDFPLFPNILLHNLCSGITTVIPDIPKLDILQMHPERIVEQIKEEKIDSLTGNVFYFREILSYLETSGGTFPYVRELGIGGSPVPEFLPHLLKKYFVRANVYIIYGSTQAEPISVRKVEGEQINPDMGYFVGTLHPNIELEIREPWPINVKGKTYSAGSIAVKGKHVIPENGSEWLVTGDFGYLDEKGELFLIARSGNEKMLKGFFHYQLEHVLLHLPGVTLAAAIAENQAFKIYIEGEADLSEIRISLKNFFPESIVGSLEKVEKMPVDSRHHSKILYRKLCTPNLKM